ncbi:MAG: tetratricopeptide repeat protein, partial [Azoarcus sp.]|nr:tetratricopeptide repeat protein [Azoarcus sp.]
MRRALAINEASYGTDHPEVAILLNNLAQLLQDTNRRAEAEPLMRRALAIFVQRLGLEHPSSQIVGTNYIGLLQEIGRTDDEIRAVLGTLIG